MRKTPIEERFWDKVLFTSDCWEWQAVKNKDGYGMIALNRKMISAHRVSYQMYKGSIPRQLMIDHLCRNRKCVNPHHMELVTNQENCIRGLTGKINNWQKRKTHCPYGHELKEPNLLPHMLKKYNYRQCKICHNERQRKYKMLGGNIHAR